MRVMGPRRSFRVILHREQWQIAVPHSFQGVVIQIHVSQFNFALGERIWIDGEIVIVGGDFNLA